MESYNLKSKIFLFYTVILIFTFLFSHFSVARAEGLVTCAGPNCNYCDFLATGNRIINFLLVNVMFPVAAIIFVVGGITIMTAGDSSSRYQKGKEMIKGTIIGIIIALLAWLVIDTLFQVLAPKAQTITSAPWYQLQCKTSSK